MQIKGSHDTINMNVEELVQKAKDLIGEGNVEHAQQFIEEHKDELGEHYHKITAMLADTTTDDLFDKIKGLLKKKKKI